MSLTNYRYKSSHRMNIKKTILFVNESLTLGGGEKSLIALLSNLNPELYEIDLQLFKYGGELDTFIPHYVNILPPIVYTCFASRSWVSNIRSAFNKNAFKFLKSKVEYSVRLRIRTYNHPEKAQLYWDAVSSSISELPKKYDVAIAYAQGVPTFYVMDKIESRQKVTWINAKPNFPNKNLLFQREYYQKYDKIIPVSTITGQQMEEIFPDLANKIQVISDIVDYNSILKMADLKKVNFSRDVFNILTVARLNLKSKRYDITLETCKILKEKGINFHWYALGEGPYREEMEKYIQQNDLQNHFSLLGTTENPYPYFKAADLYVQTSELESYGISIAEARLLNIPVVTTRFDTVFMQMIDGKNGLVTDMNAEAVANAIERILNDKDLYHSIVEYLKSEQKENTQSVAKFDKMISRLLDQNCN